MFKPIKTIFSNDTSIQIENIVLTLGNGMYNKRSNAHMW